MYSEDGPSVDLDDVRRVIQDADVFGVGFRLFGERLFVDTRTSASDGPFIGAVAPLHSVEERMFWLGRHRPRFGMPQKFAFFFWPHSVAFFEQSGIWDAIRNRVATDSTAARDAERALSELQRLEREAMVAAIQGDNHRTLWQSKSSRHNR